MPVLRKLLFEVSEISGQPPFKSIQGHSQAAGLPERFLRELNQGRSKTNVDVQTVHGSKSSLDIVHQIDARNGISEVESTGQSFASNRKADSAKSKRENSVERNKDVDGKLVVSSTDEDLRYNRRNGIKEDSRNVMIENDEGRGRRGLRMRRKGQRDGKNELMEIDNKHKPIHVEKSSEVSIRKSWIGRIDDKREAMREFEILKENRSEIDRNLFGETTNSFMVNKLMSKSKEQTKIFQPELEKQQSKILVDENHNGQKIVSDQLQSIDDEEFEPTQRQDSIEDGQISDKNNQELGDEKRHLETVEDHQVPSKPLNELYIQGLRRQISSGSDFGYPQFQNNFVRNAFSTQSVISDKMSSSSVISNQSFPLPPLLDPQRAALPSTCQSPIRGFNHSTIPSFHLLPILHSPSTRTGRFNFHFRRNMIELYIYAL